MLRALPAVFLLFSTGLTAQSRWADTTFYQPGIIETVSWYSDVPLASLSTAERFQRGLSGDSRVDSVAIRDSVHYFDTQGNRAPTTPRLARERAQFTRERKERRERVQALIRAGKLSPFAAPSPIRLECRAGEILTDTLSIRNISTEALRVRVGTEGPILVTVDTLRFAGEQTLNFPVVMLGRPGSQAVRTQLETPDGEVLFAQHYTVLGYDLHADDFNESAGVSGTRDWQAGRTLYLRVPGNRKLLTIRQADAEDRMIPLGRELDPVSTTDWLPGDYTLVLSNLGTRKESFYYLRVW